MSSSSPWGAVQRVCLYKGGCTLEEETVVERTSAWKIATRERCRTNFWNRFSKRITLPSLKWSSRIQEEIEMLVKNEFSQRIIAYFLLNFTKKYIPFIRKGVQPWKRWRRRDTLEFRRIVTEESSSWWSRLVVDPSARDSAVTQLSHVAAVKRRSGEVISLVDDSEGVGRKARPKRSKRIQFALIAQHTLLSLDAQRARVRLWIDIFTYVSLLLERTF